jgi:hypothetical protein
VQGEEEEEEVAGRGCVFLVVLLSVGYLCALAVLLYYVAVQGELREGLGGGREVSGSLSVAERGSERKGRAGK